MFPWESCQWGIHDDASGRTVMLAFSSLMETVTKVAGGERSRKTAWKEFPSRHWELIVAADFFDLEVGTRRGLQRFMVLFLSELSTRKVEIAGIAPVASGLWMSPIARNLTDAEAGMLTGKRYLIHDRDPLFTAEFLNLIADAGVEPVRLPPRSPNLNAYAERLVHGIKESCRERMIFFGEEPLRTAIQDFVAHYQVVGS